MTVGSITFRLATTEDAVPLEHLINTAYRSDKTTQVFLTTELAARAINIVSVASITAKIADPNTIVLVAVDPHGALVGHCNLRQLDNKGLVSFGTFAVDVSRQSRGLGSQMMAYAEEYARRELGATEIEIEVVHTRAGLIEWYKSWGYMATGRTTPFPYHVYADRRGGRGGLRDGLEFAVFRKDLTKVHSRG